MLISEIIGNGKITNLTGTIEMLENPKETPYGTCQDGIMSDETGQIKMSLWKDQIGKYNVGDKITIHSGWCKIWKDIKQVSTGKFGKISKVDSDAQ